MEDQHEQILNSHPDIEQVEIKKKIRKHALDLKRELKSLYSMVLDSECFGTTDLLKIEQLEKKLLDLGYSVFEERTTRIIKIR
jgi:hypothetical protein